ncbi:hypothetical protein [Alloacidobacterium sp.]|uniref:hypothetical protein n=1 Tax=Alloacidobacterium sp. TaxID=2951999 RepID=UPI002D692E13|nr:hypothetical protein [Alloacidobacterium sp.]HYK37215.1 hypothetical protein [Alloacidobacterium sp.]
MLHIYLDTNLWNELLKQGVNPNDVVSSLASKDTRLVLSDESIYELAKTFMKDDSACIREGRRLFSYLKEFIALEVPVTKDNMAMVAAEMQALQWQIADIYPFLTPDDYEIVQSMVSHLSNGEMTDEENERTNARLAQRTFDRKGQVSFFAENPNFKKAYLDIAPDFFPLWIQREERTPRAIQYLAIEIHNYFPEYPMSDAAEYAVALRSAGANRVSRGLIRRNIYINWRAAHRDSIPKDIYPDSTHIVNANYCDIYATKEKGQAQYAHLLLSEATRVCVYDSQMPIDIWLLSCAGCPTS